MNAGQVMLLVQGVIYLGASVAYLVTGKAPMAVVMMCYGITNFGLMRL